MQHEPHVSVRRYGTLGDVECWDFFNWMRAGAYQSPELWFSVPVSSRIHSITLRNDGRQTRSDSACVLVGAPDDVCVVERLDGRELEGDECTLLSMMIPRETIDADLWQTCSRELRSGLLPCARTASAMRSLNGQLRTLGAQPSLEHEEKLLDLLLLALPQSAQLVARNASVCSRAVSKTREYIHAHWRQPLSLTTIARELDVTKWHLTRSFTQTHGLTPSAYQRAVRAGHALRALARGGRPMSVALDSGYSDQSHFTREMRSMFGFTPASYRAGTGVARALTAAAPAASAKSTSVSDDE